MRLGTVNGRAVVVRPEGPVDLAAASGDRFPADPVAVLGRWDEVRGWEAGLSPEQASRHLVEGPLGPPVPRPGQVLAVGLNYRRHAAEAGLPLPGTPMIFTKFPSCVTGPRGEVALPTPQTDWEVELAVVVGAGGRCIPRRRAWDHVAGVTLAQDFSARDVQFSSPGVPQFSLGKSFAGFLPLGPVLVTPDELPDRDAVPLTCTVDGDVRQDSDTSDLVFGVAELVEYLSSVVRLDPGDLILTGTPSGVGAGHEPPVYLRPGQTVTTSSPVIGVMEHVMVAPDAPWSWSP